MSTLIDLLIGTLTQGLIYAQLAFGLYITYKLLDFPDLTVDGSFPLGAAITAVAMASGCNPYLALLVAAATGALAGLNTGWIHVRLKVRDLLAIAAGKALGPDEACSYLTKVGLCARDYLDRDVDTSLSGGEVKRIEIASILAKNAELMLFDEPEAGIDLWSFARLTETFRQLHDEGESTLIIISHQERIIRLADEIVLIADGKVAGRGSVDELYPRILADTVAGCNMLEVNGQC